MDEKRLLELANELRRMIVSLDESEAERNIASAIVYIDCARLNVSAEKNGRQEWGLCCSSSNCCAFIARQ